MRRSFSNESDRMTASHPFSVNYQQARQKFITSSRVAGAEIDSFANSCSGIGGAGLFTDVASIGRAAAANVLVLMSGTHGVEGFAGSAIQCHWLPHLAAQLAKQPQLGVILIHALVRPPGGGRGLQGLPAGFAQFLSS